MRVIRFSIFLVTLFAALALHPAAAQPAPESDSPSDTNGAETEPDIAISMKLNGQMPNELRSLIESLLAEASNKPARSYVCVDGRIEETKKVVERALNSYAYYNGLVRARAQRQEDGSVLVNFRVEKGPPTLLDSFAITYDGPGASDPELPKTAAAFGFQKGEHATAARIIELTKDALAFPLDNGYPNAEETSRRILVNIETQKANATLTIRTGQKMKFGPVSISGLEETDAAYVLDQVTFEKGELYDLRKRNKTVEDIRSLGLFSRVTSTLGPVNAQGEAPLLIDVTEEKFRTIGAGVRWSTNNGFGGRVYWEHRNILGEGELLRLEAQIEQINQSAGVHFKKPQVWRKNQSAFADFTFANEDSDAYTERRLSTQVGLEREISNELTVSGAVNFQILNSDTADEGPQGYRLLGAVLSGIYDNTNDIFDPTEGIRTGLSVAPYAGYSDTPISFVRSEFTGSHYLSLIDKQKLILANRVRVGSDLASQREDLPGSFRFYAGGGGSIRGYAYQTVGPLDSSNDPIGGRSVFEVSSELRSRFYGDFGAVAFFEGGNVFESVVPTFSDGMYWSTGMGLRYYTPVGPVRIDVGFPLRRRSIDKAFQVYFSLGQAF